MPVEIELFILALCGAIVIMCIYGLCLHQSCKEIEKECEETIRLAMKIKEWWERDDKDVEQIKEVLDNLSKHLS